MKQHTACLLVFFSLFASSLLFTPNANAAQDPAPADSALRKIKELYDESNYLTAEIEGRRLLEGGEISDTIRIQVEEYIAFSLIAQDKPQPAASHFWNILQQDSSFNLDPQLTSPKILSIFQRTRERFFAEHQPVSERQFSSAVSQPISYRTMIFPGWEQLHRGRTNVGYAFLSVGAVSLLTTIYCDFQRRSSRDSYLQASTTQLITDRYAKYNRYFNAEVYSAVIFALTYVLSEVDVFTAGQDVKGISAGFLRGSNHAVVSIRLPL